MRRSIVVAFTVDYDSTVKEAQSNETFTISYNSNKPLYADIFKDVESKAISVVDNAFSYTVKYGGNSKEIPDNWDKMSIKEKGNFLYNNLVSGIIYECDLRSSDFDTLTAYSSDVNSIIDIYCRPSEKKNIRRLI